MNAKKTNYEIKFDEIKKKLLELEEERKKQEIISSDTNELLQEEKLSETIVMDPIKDKKEINKDKIKEKRKKEKGKTDIFIIVLSFLVPTLIVLSVIGLHSNYLLRKPFHYSIIGLCIISIVLLVYKIIKKIKNKGKNTRHKKSMYILYYVLISLYSLGCSTFLFILYGPIDNFRNWLITTAMQTMNHQYLCKWFYNDKEIDYILSQNYVLESGESTDESLINKEEKVTYANEYEEAILKRDKDAKYKIIELDVNGCKGYLAAIYDPSKVKLAVTQKLGYSGQYVTTMAKNSNAILAINGGGFSDPGNSSMGGTPTGITISNGKLVTHGQYGTQTQGGGIIGFTNDNNLVLLKNTSAREAINKGVRDAVTWGPFLIVNGNPSFIKGNGGWGYAARTAIGQRADGIVLFLAINSNTTRTNGADMVDLTEIMQNYGAINAANLDGGTSTVMVLPKAEALKYRNDCVDDYCYINDPIDGGLEHRTRAIADAWVVIE